MKKPKHLELPDPAPVVEGKAPSRRRKKVKVAKSRLTDAGETVGHRVTDQRLRQIYMIQMKNWRETIRAINRRGGP